MYSLTFANPRLYIAAALLAFVAFFGMGKCGSDGPLLPAYHAEAHDRGDFLPNLPTWLQQQIFTRGYATYAMDSRTTGWPGGNNSPASTIVRCLNEETKITTVPWYPATPGSRADLTFYMPDGMDMSYAGSSYYTSIPAFINVNFRVGYTIWDSTYCHEIGHSMGQEDLYKHPLTCDTFAKYTMMSCGTYIGVPQPYDRDIQRNAFMPDLPSVAWVYNDSRFTWLNWNGVRKSSVGCSPFAGAAINYPSTEKDNYCGHYSRFIDNATQVAIFYNDGAGWGFTGYYGEPANGDGIKFRGFDRSWWCPSWSPNRHWGVRPESAIPGTWYGWDFSLSYVSGDIADIGSC